MDSSEIQASLLGETTLPLCEGVQLEATLCLHPGRLSVPWGSLPSHKKCHYQTQAHGWAAHPKLSKEMFLFTMIPLEALPSNTD